MATATVTTDLTEITDCDTTTAGGTWSGTTASTGTSDPAPLEGSAWIGGILKKDGDSMTFTPTSSIDMSSSHIRWIWMTIMKPNMKTQALGGFTMTVTGSTSGTAVFNVSGSDQYIGGWEVIVVDPYATPDSGTQVVGNVSSIQVTIGLNVSGKNIITTNFDWISYGNGLKAYGGTSGDEITMADIDTQDVYYLLNSKIKGVFQLTGSFQLGDDVSTNNCYFKDNGQVLIFQDLKVNDTLYKIKVAGNATGTTIVDLSGNFITSVSNPYSVDMTDSTNVTSITIDGTTFQNATAGVDLSSVVSGVGTVFDGCDRVDPGGATLDGVTIKNSTASGTAEGSLMVNVDTEGESCTNMSFLGYTGATTYAVYVASSVTEFDMDNWYFDDPNNTTSYALYWAGSAGTLTVNALNGTNLVTAGCTSAGGTVTVISNPVTTQVTVRNTASPPVAIENALVFIYVTDSSNYFYEASVSITGSGTTATVTHNTHGLSTGDYIWIKGVTNDDAYNGSWQVTVSDANTYTYTTSQTISSSPATGTSITSTMVVIKALTNSSGIVSDTRTWTVDQPIAGWARKSSSSPYYQQGSVIGTIDKDAGIPISLQLVSDE